MAVKRYTALVSNTSVGADNMASVGFTFNNANSDAENAAAVILYLASVSAQMMAGNSGVESISMRAAGSLGSVDIPFPDSEFDALQTALAGANVSTASMSAYGVLIGGGDLAPIGTSVCVTERTGTLGRTGIGRHFLPFVTSAAVSGDGLLATANGTNIELSYAAVFFDGAFVPVVSPASLASPKPVTTVRANDILSSLRTRRR